MKPLVAKTSSRLSSFTLVELLAVIAIIAILAALSISSFSGVQRSALRSRAANEIKTMGAALESYKADNGGYPTPASPIFTSTNVYTTTYPTGTIYQQSSQLLYQSLTGQTNYGDLPPTPASGLKVYMTFKRAQLGNYTTGGILYIQDPFGYPYGYFNGNTTSVPFNGTNQYDLWSTAGDINATNMPGWVNNWGGGAGG